MSIADLERALIIAGKGYEAIESVGAIIKRFLGGGPSEERINQIMGYLQVLSKIADAVSRGIADTDLSVEHILQQIDTLKLQVLSNDAAADAAVEARFPKTDS